MSECTLAIGAPFLSDAHSGTARRPMQSAARGRAVASSCDGFFPERR